MPLQKPSPNSRCFDGSKSATEQQILRRRRYTLQTIGELAPQQHGALQEPIVPSSRGDKNRYLLHSNEKVSSKSSKISRRQSLPTQWSTSRHGHASTAGVPVAPTGTPALRRSFTDSKNSSSSARNKSRRRSMPSSFEPRGRSLSPVAEGELPRYQIHTDNFRSLEPGHEQSEKEQSGQEEKEKEKEKREQCEAGWNARRKRELVKREQALFEGNAQRERERLRIRRSALASSSTPLPDPRTRSSHHLLQPLPSNQTTASGSNHLQNRVRDGRSIHGSIIDGRLFLDFYGSDQTATSDLRRSLSTESEPRLPPCNDRSNRMMIAHMRSPSSNSYTSSVSIEHHLADPRSSSSLQTSFSSTRPSSMNSSMSGTSGATKYSRRSSFTYSRGSDHPLRQNPVSGQQDTLTGLAGANVVAPTDMTHIGLYSRQIAQSRQVGGTQIAQGSLQPRTSLLPREISRTPTRWRESPSTVHFNKAGETNDVIFRENPDKRGMAPRRPSRHERNEIQRQAAREKTQERVRRANELEKKKEQELAVEEKEQSKDKRKRRGARGLFCGLFGG